ncbi:MAG: hypothetical protein K6C08_11215 [Oscillospiraceae bacterium]|nr:hypothetical protein [Oscillospiraceae bacterium]
MKKTILAVLLVLSMLLPCSVCAESGPSHPILYTYYRQMGWGDRVELAYVDSSGGLWFLDGYDSGLRWPYDPEDQIRFLKENEFENLGRLDQDDLFDLKSLIRSVEIFDGSPQPAACDAGTEYSYAVRYDRDGNPEPVLLGMSGDDMLENPDPNAQGLYLAAHQLFPGVTCYGGSMGPVGFIPVSIADFCKFGDMTGASVRAFYTDCEAGPSEIELTASQQARILDVVMNGVVTGKVSSIYTTGGYTDYFFYRGDESLGSISVYDGRLYCPDGMYSIGRAVP